MTHNKKLKVNYLNNSRVYTTTLNPVCFCRHCISCEITIFGSFRFSYEPTNSNLRRREPCDVTWAGPDVEVQGCFTDDDGEGGWCQPLPCLNTLLYLCDCSKLTRIPVNSRWWTNVLAVIYRSPQFSTSNSDVWWNAKGAVAWFPTSTASDTTDFL